MRRLIPGLRRRRASPAAGTLGLLLLCGAGCAAPESLVRQLDEGHAIVCRELAGVVDRADRVFGEPRVEDRERIVQARLGLQAEYRENSDPSYTVPLRLRVPLPALERRANIFLQYDSAAEATDDFDRVRENLRDTRNLSATILSRIAGHFETGARLELTWEEGPQTGARPFLRWEWEPLPLRFYAEQQVYYLTDLGLGARSTVQADRVLDDTSFVRLLTTLEINRATPAVDVEHALIYRRRLAGEGSVLSVELGTVYNTYDGDTGTRERGGAADPDEAYATVRVIGTVFRPWIEYEIAPALHGPWRHGDKLEYGITFTLRLVTKHPLAGRGASPATRATSK